MFRKPPHKRLLALATAVVTALPFVAGAADTDLSVPPPLKTATAGDAPRTPWISAVRLEPAQSDEDSAAVVFAHEISGSPETQIVLKGEAELRRAGSVIKADKIVYTQFEDLVQGTGNAELSRSGLTLRSPEIFYHLDSKTGQTQEAEFEFAPNRLRGEASCVRFQSGETTDLDNSLITTCRKGDDSWWIELDKLTLDEYDQSGYGRNAVLKLAGVPVFAVPWFTFPTAGKRQSGLLVPSLSVSKTRGLDVSIPYYWNIAPNYDYTITPRLMSKAGIMLGNDIRLLTRDFSAQVIGDYLPHDSSKDAPTGARWGVTAKLSGNTAGIGYGIDYNRISDDNFNADFGNSLRDDSDSVLTEDFWVNFSRKYVNGQISIRKNQALDVRGTTTSKPYEKVPQITLSGYVADLDGFELTTELDLTRFRHPKQLEGDRFVFDQTVSYPLRGAGWFFTPKARIIGTWYNLDDPVHTDGDKHPSRILPIFSADAGLTFERTLTLDNRALTQTLEPRLFYAYIPYEDQSEIPVFDSSLSDMNFAQIFTENTWSGYDRINEANHVTTALTTRFLEDTTGSELFRAAVGQRFYLSDTQIGYNGKRTDLPNRKADLLASVGAKLFKSLTVTGFAQYNYDRKTLNRASAGLRWQPKPMSVVGLYYRYNYVDGNPKSDLNFKQLDFSAQWPIAGNLYALSRLNYSLLKKRWIEALVGLEYNADCWTLRLVGQRYVTSTDKYEMRYFVQLELRGLGGIGSSPLSTLEEGIPGYQSEKSTLVPGRIGAFDYYR